MPQMNKGGKFIFGKSIIRENGVVQIPAQAMDEYDITSEKKVYLFTGSKSTGGFCVTRKGLLKPSKLGHILTDHPDLYPEIWGVYQTQRPILLLGRYIRCRPNSFNPGYDALFGPESLYGPSLHPQQRCRFYHGGKRSFMGKSPKL